MALLAALGVMRVSEEEDEREQGCWSRVGVVLVLITVGCERRRGVVAAGGERRRRSRWWWCSANGRKDGNDHDKRWWWEWMRGWQLKVSRRGDWLCSPVSRLQWLTLNQRALAFELRVSCYERLADQQSQLPTTINSQPNQIRFTQASPYSTQSGRVNLDLLIPICCAHS